MATADDHAEIALGKDPITRALVRRVTQLGPGGRLASERELSEELSVSRTALRDRVAKLESMGILERRGRLGTFVVGLRPETVSDVLMLGLMASDLTIESMVTVRIALERQAALEAAARTDHVNIAHMAVAVDAMDSSDDGEALRRADISFHQALFNASGSQALKFFSQVLAQVLSETIQSLELSEDRETMRTVHRQILDAVRSGDRDSVLKSIDNHFEWLDELIADQSQQAREPAANGL